MEKCCLLIQNLVTLAREGRFRRGDIAFEWPTQCDLWEEPEAIEMVREFALNKVSFHGCSLGLRSASTNLPIKKPWTVATTSSVMAQHFDKRQCPGVGEHPSHCPCAGSETRKTESYTREMVDIIHAAHKIKAVDAKASLALTNVTVQNMNGDEI